MSHKRRQGSGSASTESASTESASTESASTESASTESKVSEPPALPPAKVTSEADSAAGDSAATGSGTTRPELPAETNLRQPFKEDSASDPPTNNPDAPKRRTDEDSNPLD